MTAHAIPNEPPAGARTRHRVHVLASLRELLASHEMVRSLAERELRSRYKQAFLGVAWAVINPVGLMLVFTVFVRAVADVDTQGAPYGLYAYLGLIPWTFFSSSVNNGGMSLLFNNVLLNKVRCPREIFPLSSVAAAAVDTAIASLAFVGLMAITTTAPHVTSVWVLPLLWIQFAFTAAVVLLLSSLVVYFRDLRHLLAPLLQVGIFATPVAYSLESIGEQYRLLYCTLNPLAAVIDGYRRSVLLGEPPRASLTIAAALSATVVLVVAYVTFKRLEVGIADIA